MDETIMVFSAHNDDFVIGAGGAIANYVKEGKKVVCVVFSYGVKSHPWLKEDIVRKVREREARRASRILGCSVIFYDFQEFKFMDGFEDGDTRERLVKLLESEKPTKIFTHSNEDPHPDHQSVHKITLQLRELVSYDPEIYIYSVWNPVSVKTQHPTLYVDIKKSFRKKLQALKEFRTQRVHVSYPTFLLLFRSFTDGLKRKMLMSEKFFRIK